MNDLQKYGNDSIATELIKAGTFEIEKYEAVKSKTWSEEFKTMNIVSIKQAISSNTPSIATYRKYQGNDKVFILLTKLIADLSACFNVGKNMNMTQSQLTARMILKKYYFLTLADMRLCFDKGICGEYGQLYDRLDPQLILIWLDKYNEERTQHCHMEELKRKNEAEKRPVDIDREGLKKLGRLRLELMRKRIIKRQEKEMTAEEIRRGAKEAEEITRAYEESKEREMTPEMAAQAQLLKDKLNLI